MAGPHNASNAHSSTGAADSLKFNTDFDPEIGSADELYPGLARIVAPNSGPYTFTGTNTYLIGKDPLFVLDPGPDDDTHLDAILAALGGRRVKAVLLTHTHKDHSALTSRLSKQIGAPIWFGGQHRLSRPLRRFEINPLAGSCDWGLAPDRILSDGEEIEAGGVALQVMATPGHCANHLSFGVADSAFIFSGDHVMGWNSTLVATPDGDMSDYLTALDKIIASEWTRYLPGHGGSIADGRTYGKALWAHRTQRNRQIIDAVAAGDRRISRIVARLYPDVPWATRRAAAMTVMAHVEHLAREGQLRLTWRWGRAWVEHF